MEKRVIFILFVVLGSVYVHGQDMAEIYKRGRIALKPDPQFGANTDWNAILDAESLPLRPNFTISEDGSIFVLIGRKYRIYKIDNSGDIIHQFGRKGNETGAFRTVPQHISTLDNKYVLVSEYVSGRITVFDFEGHFLKQIQLDYPIHRCIGLREGKMAVYGLILTKTSVIKDYVGIIDMESEKEIQVVHHIRDMNHQAFRFPISSGTGKVISSESEISAADIKNLRRMSFSIPFKRYRTYVDRSIQGDLIVGDSGKRDVVQYSLEGKAMNHWQLDIQPQPVEDEVKEKFYASMKNAIEKYDLPDSTSDVIRRPGFFPDHTPYYNKMMTDSEGNLLIFKYSKDDETIFQVYKTEQAGVKLLCETIVDPAEYKESLVRRVFDFHDGYLYAFVTLQRETGYHFRLIRVKLTDNS